MACVCSHNKDKHDTERDSGYHGGNCSEFNCSCKAYINVKNRLENDPKSEDFQ